MYRDDVCAVCGESLPPDHFYCREHAADVDERLHEIGAIVPRLLDDLDRLCELVDGVAEETWDYIAESEPDDPVWPPAPTVRLRADAEEVDVDVDSEPGYVAVRLELGLPALLGALREGLDTAELRRAAAACAHAQGASSTHWR
jgi:hypothetical protein